VLDDVFRATPAPLSIPLSVRLSRAALVALGTGSVSLASACGAATGALLPLVADAGDGDSGTQGTSDASQGIDVVSVVPPYGISPPPPPVDAGIKPPP